MSWTGFRFILVTLMITTGTCNTLFSKLYDRIQSKGSDGVSRPFGFPFLQVGFLFIGEMLCLVAFKMMYYYVKMNENVFEDDHILVKGNRIFNPIILFPPAVLHVISASLLVIGLNLTSVASFQILRGSAIVFVVLMSSLFLKRNPAVREWIGICIIICGLLIAGVADWNESTYSVDSHVIGDSLILLGHLTKACQMVYEEHFVTKNDIPSLQAIGWEGIYGLIIVVIFLFPFYFIKVPPPFDNNPRHVLEDAPDGFAMIVNNNLLLVPTFGSIISIAFYNYAGLSITKEISSTTRMVFEIVCVIIVWSISLIIGWQEFQILGIVGFIGIISGMCIYSKFIFTKRFIIIFTPRTIEFPPVTAF